MTLTVTYSLIITILVHFFIVSRRNLMDGINLRLVLFEYVRTFSIIPHIHLIFIVYLFIFNYIVFYAFFQLSRVVP